MEIPTVYDFDFSSSPFPLFLGQETPETEEKLSNSFQPGQYESLEEMFKNTPEILERIKSAEQTPQFVQETKIEIEGGFERIPKGTLVASLFFLDNIK